ncbi:substrate-binding domain-containing protein [Kitasatospora sp. NPDC048365]|uniref:substrate-binding domain-containing protein n=1 Tax=Kitasatospora sp. NPDC048365 TaxID=3364050 RepID=UPI003718BEE4
MGARRTRTLIAAGVVLSTLWLGGPSPAHAAPLVRITGAGATSAINQVDTWISGVRQDGLKVVNYDAVGSLAGRDAFRRYLADFAVTEVPYGVPGGPADPAPDRPFAYLPVTAGGLAFPYHLTVNGQRVDNLRLSSTSLLGIFTGAVVFWNDPAIAADNPGRELPKVRIKPVVRSDSNGLNAALTGWFAAEQPAAWAAHCASTGLTECGTTKTFPAPAGAAALSSGIGVAGYVAADSSEGAIGYTTVDTTINAHLPSARVLNASGHYTAPTPGAMAVGLATARTGPDGLVDPAVARTSTDPRAYPLPLLHYLVIPTAGPVAFNPDKGNTLGTFTRYALCNQRDAAALGGAPLPAGLVQDGLATVPRIPGAAAPTEDPAICGAPATTLIADAPQPLDCDRYGAQVCGVAAASPAEVITATVPIGSLAVSVDGGGQVVLPSPVLDASGTVLRTGGELAPVTVTDTRAGNTAWTLSGQATDFTSPAGATIAARQLTWTPAVLAAGAHPVTGGPALPPGGGGLSTPRTLATGTGPGTARLGATLLLDVPTSTPAGTYRAVLTLTAI